MAKKKTRKQSPKTSGEAAPRPSSQDRLLRDHLLYLLEGGGAHINFADALAGWPAQVIGVKVANFPHTAWMLLEHMRLASGTFLSSAAMLSMSPEMARRILAGIGSAA